MKYACPDYGVDFTDEMASQCCDIAVRLLDEVGFVVRHEEFLAQIKDRPGIRIKGDRVHFDPELTQRCIEKHFPRDAAPPPARNEPSKEWQVTTAGFSRWLIDIETDEYRTATRQDLRDLIKLVNSFGVGGSYPVMPQDVPPMMRAINCFKICWEMSDNMRPYDYQQPEEARFIYEMHRVMGKTFDLTLCVPTTMTIDPKDVAVFLEFYPHLKKNRDIRFAVLDYGMLGLTAPVTATGCATITLTHRLAINMLFQLFDPEIQIPVGVGCGRPTDLRNTCWAFGSPRVHLFQFLNSRIQPALRRRDPGLYAPGSVLLETGSAAVDEQAALEKMAIGLLGALQGARTFGYAGVLCVDDVYSGVQFVIDVEMVNYIRETVEAFNPHPDIFNMDGLYDECRDVALGRDTFLSHPNTAGRFRNIIPSPDLIVREKLPTWLEHRKVIKERAREIALDRIRTFEPYHLSEDKQKELDKIYARAEAELLK